MTFKRLMGITAIAAVSVPFALWFWLSVVDIGAIPFRDRFWVVESRTEETDIGNEHIGVTLVTTLSYTTRVRCTMTAIMYQKNGQTYLDFAYQLDLPESVPEYLSEKALGGCMHFAASEVRALAEREDAEVKDVGKI